ncbi:MAG: TlpA disulfide reductase family protein [bacterium]
MAMRINWYCKLIILSGMLLVASAAQAQSNRRTTEKDYSFKAREIVSGKMMELSELTADKPLVLHVWAPDCPHCQRHMPYLASLYKKLDLEKVNFLTYSVTGQIHDAKSFLEKRNLDFPTICLSNGSFSKDLKDGGWPNTMVIGLDGKLVGSCDINGPTYVETMEKLVEKALEDYAEIQSEDEGEDEGENTGGSSWFED